MSGVQISIGIPIYREEACTDFAIASAICQPYPVDEIIISDNCIGRDQGKIAQWTKDPRVIYISSGQNVGAIGNFIRCWNAAKHRYFIWLGDDDFLHPSFASSLDRHVSKAEPGIIGWAPLPSTHLSNFGTSISGCSFASVNGASPAERIKQIHALNQWNYNFYSVIDRNAVSVNTLEYFYQNWNSDFGDFDWAWTFSLATSGKFKLLPEQLYFYCFDNWACEEDFRRSQRSRFLGFMNKAHYSETTLDLLAALNGFVFFALYIAHYIDSSISMRSHSFICSGRCSKDEYLDAAVEVSVIWNAKIRSLLTTHNDDLYLRVTKVWSTKTGEDLLLELCKVLEEYLSHNCKISGFAVKCFRDMKTIEARKFLEGVRPSRIGSQNFLGRVVDSFRKTSFYRLSQMVRVRMQRGCVVPERNSRPVFLPVQEE
jgi:glycosyltransferase involved in cell wall biosynthesis